MYSMYHWSMDCTCFPIKLAKAGIENPHWNLFPCRPCPGLAGSHSQVWCRVRTPSVWGIQGPRASQWALDPISRLNSTPIVCLLLKWIKMWVLLLLTLYESKKDKGNICMDCFTFCKRFRWFPPLTQEVNTIGRRVHNASSPCSQTLKIREPSAWSVLFCSRFREILSKQAGSGGTWGAGGGRQVSLGSEDPSYILPRTRCANSDKLFEPQFPHL